MHELLTVEYVNVSLIPATSYSAANLLIKSQYWEKNPIVSGIIINRLYNIILRNKVELYVAIIGIKANAIAIPIGGPIFSPNLIILGTSLA